MSKKHIWKRADLSFRMGQIKEIFIINLKMTRDFYNKDSYKYDFYDYIYDSEYSINLIEYIIYSLNYKDKSGKKCSRAIIYRVGDIANRFIIEKSYGIKEIDLRNSSGYNLISRWLKDLIKKN